MEKVAGGDTYKISYIKKPTSTIRTIGTDADTFDTNVLENVQVDLKVNKRAVSAFEFEDLAILQSQLEQADSPIREALLADVREQFNDWIKSNISPSSATPDHVTTSADFNNAQLAATSLLASKAHWNSSGESKYLLADPSYYSDMLKDTTLNASNIMGTNQSPVIGGMFATQRYGFNIIEDDSLATDTAYAFIPSFMKVIFGSPRFKLSDLHAQGKFGYNLSCDLALGLVQLDDTRVISIAVS